MELQWRGQPEDQEERLPTGGLFPRTIVTTSVHTETRHGLPTPDHLGTGNVATQQVWWKNTRGAATAG